MSEGYSRVLVLIGLLVGFGVVWLPVLNGHGRIFMHSCLGFLALLALGFPLAGVVMFWLVRLAPVIVPPQLIVRQSGPAYGLGLGGRKASPDQGNICTPE